MIELTIHAPKMNLDEALALNFGVRYRRDVSGFFIAGAGSICRAQKNGKELEVTIYSDDQFDARFWDRFFNNGSGCYNSFFETVEATHNEQLMSTVAKHPYLSTFRQSIYDSIIYGLLGDDVDDFSDMCGKQTEYDLSILPTPDQIINFFATATGKKVLREKAKYGKLLHFVKQIDSGIITLADLSVSGASSAIETLETLVQKCHLTQLNACRIMSLTLGFGNVFPPDKEATCALKSIGVHSGIITSFGVDSCLLYLYAKMLAKDKESEYI